MRVRIAASIGVAAAAIAVGAFVLAHRARPKAPPATAAPVLAGDLILPGRIEARHIVPIGATADGVVEVRLADSGQEVGEGQLLARIKNTALEAERDRAQADLERSQSRAAEIEGSIAAARLEASRAAADSTRANGEFARAEKMFQRQQLLFREGATPRLTYEKSLKDYEMARTEQETLSQVSRQADDRVSALVQDLELARKNLDEKTRELDHAKEDLLATEIFSPVGGIVVANKAEPGSQVDRTTKDLFQIAVDLSLLRVVVDLAPDALPRVRTGQQAVIQLADLPNEGLPGEVSEVGQGRAVIDFVSPSPGIRPGLTAHVRIKLP